MSLFEEMVATGITPDVVSCTALINALATAGQADKAEAVVKWMLANGLQPNVRKGGGGMCAREAASRGMPSKR